MLSPEQIARQQIDKLLGAAGWTLQNPDEFNRKAALGVAVREFQLTTGPCDYLLFVDGKAAGVVEAKKEGVTLSGVADQPDVIAGEIVENLEAALEQFRSVAEELQA